MLIMLEGKKGKTHIFGNVLFIFFYSLIYKHMSTYSESGPCLVGKIAK